MRKAAVASGFANPQFSRIFPFSTLFRSSFFRSRVSGLSSSPESKEYIQRFLRGIIYVGVCAIPCGNWTRSKSELATTGFIREKKIKLDGVWVLAEKGDWGRICRKLWASHFLKIFETFSLKIAVKYEIAWCNFGQLRLGRCGPQSCDPLEVK